VVDPFLGIGRGPDERQIFRNRRRCEFLLYTPGLNSYQETARSEQGWVFDSWKTGRRAESNLILIVSKNWVSEARRCAPALRHASCTPMADRNGVSADDRSSTSGKFRLPIVLAEHSYVDCSGVRSYDGFRPLRDLPGF
jgi:hypothetical protein